MSTKKHFAFGASCPLQASISTAHSLFRKCILCLPLFSCINGHRLITFSKIPFEYDCLVILSYCLFVLTQKNQLSHWGNRTCFIIHGRGKLSFNINLCRTADRLTAYVITYVAASSWRICFGLIHALGIWNCERWIEWGVGKICTGLICYSLFVSFKILCRGNSDMKQLTSQTFAN